MCALDSRKRLARADLGTGVLGLCGSQSEGGLHLPSPRRQTARPRPFNCRQTRPDQVRSNVAARLCRRTRANYPPQLPGFLLMMNFMPRQSFWIAALDSAVWIAPAQCARDCFVRSCQRYVLRERSGAGPNRTVFPLRSWAAVSSEGATGPRSCGAQWGKARDRGPHDGRNNGRTLRLNAKGNERFPRVRSFSRGGSRK